jgi:hypothetical protein
LTERFLDGLRLISRTAMYTIGPKSSNASGVCLVLVQEHDIASRLVDGLRASLLTRARDCRRAFLSHRGNVFDFESQHKYRAGPHPIAGLSASLHPSSSRMKFKQVRSQAWAWIAGGLRDARGPNSEPEVYFSDSTRAEVGGQDRGFRP